jgi:RHS repeat-associated protein
VARYTYGPGYIDAVAIQERDLNSDDDFGDDDEVVYYHGNALHSVYCLTDDGENVVERYRFDGYGACTVLDADGSDDSDNASDVDNPFLFTGRRLDSEWAGMQYRSRSYSTTLGRFVSRDLVEYAGASALYAYAGGNPAAMADPMGLLAVTVRFSNRAGGTRGESTATFTVGLSLSTDDPQHCENPGIVQIARETRVRLRPIREHYFSRHAWSRTKEYSDKWAVDFRDPKTGQGVNEEYAQVCTGDAVKQYPHEDTTLTEPLQTGTSRQRPGIRWHDDPGLPNIDRERIGPFNRYRFLLALRLRLETCVVCFDCPDNPNETRYRVMGCITWGHMWYRVNHHLTEPVDTYRGSDGTRAPIPAADDTGWGVRRFVNGFMGQSYSTDPRDRRGSVRESVFTAAAGNNRFDLLPPSDLFLTTAAEVLRAR